MKMTTIRAKHVNEYRGFLVGEGCTMDVHGQIAVPGDFVIVDEEGAMAGVVHVDELAESYNVLKPRGRKPGTTAQVAEAAPPFASEHQQPRQLTVDEVAARAET